MEEEIKRKKEENEKQKKLEMESIKRKCRTEIVLPGKLNTPRRSTPRIHYGKE